MGRVPVDGPAAESVAATASSPPAGLAVAARPAAAAPAAVAAAATAAAAPLPPPDHPAQKRWPIIRDMIERGGIARQHIESYDWFVERGMQAIVDDVGRVEVDHPDGPYAIRLGAVDLLEPRAVELDRSVSPMSPREARLRRATYMAPVRVEFSVEGHDGIFGPWKKMHVGDIPVMVRSGACVLHNLDAGGLVRAGEDPDDPGGYFVVNGSERVVVAHEDASHNRILVGEVAAAAGGGRPVRTARLHSAMVGYRTRLEVVQRGDGPVVVRTGLSPVDLPVVAVMRALGMETDREIASAVSVVPAVADLMEYSFDVVSGAADTARGAADYIARRIAPGLPPENRDRAMSFLLDVGLLPHVGRGAGARLEKAALLGEAAGRILELGAGAGAVPADDRDHCGNKTVRFAGQLLADVFRSAFRGQMRDMAARLSGRGARRTPGAVGAAINTNAITDRVCSAVSTGNWGRGLTGVSQALDRLNHLATVSHLRRVVSPLSKSGEHILARDVHSTYFGRICPCETPEGAGCGLVKSLALEAVVSTDVPASVVRRAIERSGVGMASPYSASADARRTGTRVFVDGRLAGFAADGDRLADSLRGMRRAGRLHPHVGIAMHRPGGGAQRRLYVSCNAGRLLRPLLVLGGDGLPVMDDSELEAIAERRAPWTRLLASGALELVDAHEEEEAYIAVGEGEGGSAGAGAAAAAASAPATGNGEKGKAKKAKTAGAGAGAEGGAANGGGHTHMEVYPPAMLSAIASIIPYPEHNQSPRNTYESAMAKQSLGFSTPLVRTGTAARQHMMVYPQAPIVRTRAMGLIGIEDRPAGVNCVVAVLPFDGYNIEDSVVLSKQSVERGLARSVFYRLYTAAARRYDGGLSDRFGRPDPSRPPGGYPGAARYARLDDTGTAWVGAPIAPGDMVVGRMSPPRFVADKLAAAMAGAAKGGDPAHMRDTSVMARPGERGRVDAVILSQSPDGTPIFRVSVAEMRSPEVGDKFAARHGQKGVCGILARGEDLPYTDDGVVPDLLINPHAFPSRMTIGMFVEMIAGKAAAVRGRRFDASAFVGEKVGHVRAALEAAGYSYTGRQRMYDGRTGRPFRADTFVGIAYYQRLQHMAADKIHGRARGPRQMLTGQPTHGKARGGGLRFGEMERDCMVAYGASAMLRDRMFDSSDRTEARVCERCGQFAYYDVADGAEKCRVCGPRARVSRARMSRAFRLLVQEVQGLGITMRLALRFGG